MLGIRELGRPKAGSGKLKEYCAHVYNDTVVTLARKATVGGGDCGGGEVCGEVQYRGGVTTSLAGEEGSCMTTGGRRSADPSWCLEHVSRTNNSTSI